MPTINLQLNQYATIQQPFSIINRTNQNLDQILKSNFIVNTDLSLQAIRYLSNYSQLKPNNSFAGIVFNQWISRNFNNLTLLYNDSALLSVPYLIHTITNFYSRFDGESTINATLSPWPRTIANSILNTIDYSSFSAVITLGIGLVMPLVTFAVEIVADKEVIFKTY